MDRTVLARLHYDGSRFVGWQRQRTDRTVQGEVEAVLERLCGQPIPVQGAGRTDAGVHAIGMAMSAVLPARWAPAALRRALNALLPADCWVEAVCPVRPGFHARKSAIGRAYEYRIGTDVASESPFRRPYEWALARSLDGLRLARCAEQIVGRHDFRALAVHTGQRRNCHCEVRSARWVPFDGDRAGWRFEIAADRFLHHMVRILVGTMADVALERRPEEDLARLLGGEAGTRASPPAPPQGLYFVRADYPAQWFTDESEAG
jgi:tRNA pseudouridine38-40 synthase